MIQGEIMDQQKIIERLKLLRRRAGVSAREVSKNIGCGDGYVSRLEKGKYFPPICVLGAMLKAYRSSFEELYYEDFENYKFDKEIFELLKIVNPDSKTRTITLLTVINSIEDDKSDATKIVCKGLGKIEGDNKSKYDIKSNKE